MFEPSTKISPLSLILFFSTFRYGFETLLCLKNFLTVTFKKFKKQFPNSKLEIIQKTIFKQKK